MSRDLCNYYAEQMNLPEESAFMRITNEYQTLLWFPDTEIENMLYMKPVAVKQYDRAAYIIRRKENCAILSFRQLTAEVHCKLELNSYPNDIQVCDFSIRSCKC